MNVDDCAEFVEQIRRHFAFLVTEYGFEFAETRRVGGGEHCLALLRSNRCLLRFVSNAGSVEIGVATASAPVGWEDVSAGVRYWYNLEGILDYLKNRVLSEEENRQLGERFWKMSRDAYLEHIAQDLFPVRDRLLDAFEEKTFDRRRGEIEAFLGI
jgi:hypothetical protein